MEIPKDICTDPFSPNLNEIVEYPGMSCSSLFRGSTRLEETVPHAIENYKQYHDNRPFHALSVGVSYGPEIDSLAAHISNHNIAGARLLGVDSNANMIMAAQQGQYVWDCECRDQMLPQAIAADEERLRALGFTATPQGDGQWTIIDSQALRAQHDMLFESFSINEISSIDAEVDLVSCNNTLPYAIANNNEEAVAIACLSIAATMRTGGVFSISCMDEFVDPSEDPDYTHWHSYLESGLGELGMRAIVTNKNNVGMAFQKQ